MGKTLWEMLTTKTAGPPELRLVNPLHLRLGNNIVINDLDYKDLTFNVMSVSEFTRKIGSGTFIFTDYDLVAKPLSGEEVHVRLRLNPRDQPDPVAGLTHNVVMLSKYDEMAYDENFLNYIKDTNTFQVNEDGVPTEFYYRINDVKGSYKAHVRYVSQESSDFLVKDIEYWDFWREIRDEGGTAFNQFFFVEMNNDDGWFTMWRGKEVDAQDIMVL